MIQKYEFNLFLLKEESNSLFDLDDAPKKAIHVPKFYGPKGELLCLSGYEEHTPMIRNFASQSPENFAQVLMFSPLSANITFSDLFEGFPVLMYWLRDKNKVTSDELSAFINGLTSTSKRQILAKVIGREGAWKIRTIVEVWNKRKQLFDKANKLNDEGDMEGLISLFSNIPGVGPVKAGFISQLIFGKLGCLDTHNVDMYTALSKKMGWGLEKYLDINAWNNPRYKEEGVKAYVSLLKRMDQELGIGTRELWDLWVDLVGELYRKSRDEEVYSSEFGPAVNPHDPKWKDIRGDVGTTFQKTTSGGRLIDLTPAGGHPEGMGVSKVHQMAALDPKELMDQMIKGKVGSKHVFNSVVRDKRVAPLLLHYKDILTNTQKLKHQIGIGKALTKQIRIKKEAKDVIISRLTEIGWTPAEAARIVKDFENAITPEEAKNVHLPLPLFR